MATVSVVQEDPPFDSRDAGSGVVKPRLVENLFTDNTLNYEKLEQPVEACTEQSPICGHPGKRLFISTTAAHPSSRPDCYLLGQKGYGGPYQHPRFTTSNATYGRIEPPTWLNRNKFPTNCQFTLRQRVGGTFKDVSFTTSLD